MSDFLGRLVARTQIPAGVEPPAGTVQPRLRTRFEPPDGVGVLPFIGRDQANDVLTERDEEAFIPATVPFRPSTLGLPPQQSPLVGQPLALSPLRAAGPIQSPSGQTAQQPHPQDPRDPRAAREVVARPILEVAASMNSPGASMPEQHQSERVPDTSRQARLSPPAAAFQSHSQPVQPDRLLTTMVPLADEPMFARLRAELHRLRSLSPPMEERRALSPLVPSEPTIQSSQPYPGTTALEQGVKSGLKTYQPKMALSPGQQETRTPALEPHLSQITHIQPQTLARLRVALRQDKSGALTKRANETREASRPPAIVVHIGRIEVRATPPAPAPRRPQPQSRPAVQSLDDYLRRRNGQGEKG